MMNAMCRHGVRVAWRHCWHCERDRLRFDLAVALARVEKLEAALKDIGARSGDPVIEYIARAALSENEVGP